MKRRDILETCGEEVGGTSPPGQFVWGGAYLAPKAIGWRAAFVAAEAISVPADAAACAGEVTLVS